MCVLYINYLFKCNCSHQMFLSISRHGQWLVCDVNGLVLVGFKGHVVCNNPLFALDDRCVAAVLTGGVDDGKALSV